MPQFNKRGNRIRASDKSLVFRFSSGSLLLLFLASYQESNKTRLNIAEHLRKLPMSFFNTKDLSELTTNMMSDCSSIPAIIQVVDFHRLANTVGSSLTTE